MRHKQIRVWRVLFFGLIIVVSFLLVVFAISIRSTINEVIVTPNTTQKPQASPTPTPDPLAPYGILLLGLRGDNSIGGYLTDTMILARIDPREEKINLVSVPRDLWVPIPISETETIHSKINAAYAIGLDDRKYLSKSLEFTGAAGGGTLAKHIAQQIFGIPVRYFISVDFDGFKKTIDVLGGIDVNVTKPLLDQYYPITGKEADSCGKTEEDIAAITATLSGDLLEQQFGCRYETLVFEKGVVHMDGETALKFARSRHASNDGSDFARSARQKQVILATKDKILQIGFITRAIPFLQSLSGDLRTDIPLEVMSSMIPDIAKYSKYTIVSTSLSTENALIETYSSDGQYILIPKSGIDNWKSIQDFVNPTPLNSTN